MDNVLGAIKLLNLKEMQFTGMNLSSFLARVERAAIENMLNSTSGSVTSAATYLGINRTTLVMKMKRLGLVEFKEKEDR